MKTLKNIVLSIMLLFGFVLNAHAKDINLNDLSNIKTYGMKDFDEFINDYNNNNLDNVYLTRFLFDGASMYKPYDLDDFVKNGNDYVVEPLELTVININTTGDITFTGELTGGMIAVNTNNKKGNINIILDNAKLDTGTKKAPAIYVYNKDILYTDAIVTIKTTENSKNYIEGGKLKKVSLIPRESFKEDKKIINYYGVYTKDELNKILFAKVEANQEDTSEGKPKYYYKANGVISSDIDLYFEGLGYLEITSKNKEGIEGKGNITFSGGTGDYVILAEEDCINATSSGDIVHNTVTVDVNSLYAIVDKDATGGDGIDSNGDIYMNGGLYVGIPHTRFDAGLDSEDGIYINGGTIFATGDLLGKISDTSNQKFIILDFNGDLKSNKNISLYSSKSDILFSYTTDRDYDYNTSSVLYSSEKLTDGYYKVYRNSKTNGESKYGYYETIKKSKKGTLLGYKSTIKNMNNNRNSNGIISYDSKYLGNIYDKFEVKDIANQFGMIDDYNNYKLKKWFKNNKYIVASSVGVVALVVLYCFKRKKKNNQ